MRALVPPDPETRVSGPCYAVVYAPGRRRGRFAAGCVELVASPGAARAGASARRHRYAARLLGPSKSSEGQVVYYLGEWLE